MHILVWGVSPLASRLAAHLHAQGHTVRWIADEAIKSQLDAVGKLVEQDKAFDLPPIFVHPDAVLKPPLDKIILAMPGWAVSNALTAIVKYIPPHHYPFTLIFTTGMGIIEKALGTLGAEKSIQAISTREWRWGKQDKSFDYSKIIEISAGDVVLAEHPHQEQILPLLRGLGFHPSIAPAESLNWSYLLWKLQTNALPTLLGIVPQDVYRDRRILKIELAQLREAIEVIDHLKIKLISLPNIQVRRLAKAIRWLPQRPLSWILRSLTDKLSPSLSIDFERETGRSDAAYLNGAVARAAYDHRIAAPVNHSLALALTDIAEGRAVWSQFRNKVDYLETYIRVATPSLRPRRRSL
jgi:ketopantoate reductase